MQTRTLLAGLVAGTLAVSANAALVSATITGVSGDPVNGNAAASDGLLGTGMQDGIVGGGNGAGVYLTNAPGGFPSDYIAAGTTIVMSYDFGGTVSVSSFLAGLYAWDTQRPLAGHPNSATQFTIDLGTTAGGNDVASGIVVDVDIDGPAGQLISLGGTFNAAFATVTVTDNGFVAPGNQGGGGAGGDRVGFSEAAFDDTVVPEPGSLALLGLGGLALLRRRRA